MSHERTAMKSPGRFPFRFQVALHDCAPACVQALADFYGICVTIGQLRDRLRTDPLRGTTVNAFQEGLSDLFKVEVGRVPTGLVPSELLPFIGYLPRLRHYVTVWTLEERRGRVLLGDPAAGLTSEVVPLRVEVEVAVPDLTPAEW
jgi:ABC-type bacteriocin/lantibiotic exporter with double-glycine peptidase domain